MLADAGEHACPEDLVERVHRVDLRHAPALPADQQSHPDRVDQNVEAAWGGDRVLSCCAQTLPQCHAVGLEHGGEAAPDAVGDDRSDLEVGDRLVIRRTPVHVGDPFRILGKRCHPAAS